MINPVNMFQRALFWYQYRYLMGYHTSVEAILRIKLIFFPWILYHYWFLSFHISRKYNTLSIWYVIDISGYVAVMITVVHKKSQVTKMRQHSAMLWQVIKQGPTIQTGNKICFDGCMHLKTFQWHKQHIDHATVCIKWWMHHSAIEFVFNFSFVSFCLFCNCGLAIPTCITARALRTFRDACRDR